MKKKNILSLTLFFILTGLCVSLLYSIVSWKTTSDGAFSSTKQLYNTPKDSIDVVFLGSSHVYFDVYPSILWRDYHYASFDMSCSAMLKEESVHHLKELLKTQSPKEVYVETYGLLFDEQLVFSNYYRSILTLRPGFNRLDLIKTIVPEKDRPDFYFKWSIVHNKYDEFTKYDFVSYPANSYGKGAYYFFRPAEISGLSFNPGEIKPGVLSNDDYKYFNELIELSEEYGFKLSFFASPYCIGEDGQAKINAAAKYLTSLGYTFTDFNLLWDELKLDINTDFADAEHLNANGAAKLTAYFANNLIDPSLMVSDADDKIYEQWDKDLLLFEQLEYDYSLKATSDPLLYADRLLENQNITAVISLEPGYFPQATDYISFLGHLGVDSSEAALGGKWVIENKEIKKVLSNEPLAEPVGISLSKYDTFVIQYKDLINSENILFNNKGQLLPYNNMTILVYDKITEELTDIRGF